MKKDGGIIEKWQLHHLSVPEGYEGDFKERFPDVIFPPIMFTGTVKEDPTGRWESGFHMRSTYIVNLDRETGICETQNTIYKLDMKTEGQDTLKDLGNDVLKIFY